MNRSTHLLDLPVDLLADDLFLTHLTDGHEALASLSCVSKHLRSIGTSGKLWEKAFENRWGEIRDIHREAAALATSWRALYQAKHITELSGEGWTRPCDYEAGAFLAHLARAASKPLSSASSTASQPCKPGAAPASPTTHLSCASVLSPAPSTASSLSSSPSVPAPLHAYPSWGTSPNKPQPSAPPAPEVQLVYLLDGSGSVSEEDFAEMRKFVLSSAPQLCSLLGAGEAGKIGVIQFSTEPRIEVPLAALGPNTDTLNTALNGIVRISGGTNIASAIAKAGSMMKTEDQAALNGADPVPPAADAPPDMELEPGHLPDPILIMPEDPPQSPFTGAFAQAPSPVHHHLPGGAVPVPMPGAPHNSPSTSAGVGPSTSSAATAAGLPASKPVRLVLLLTDGRVDTYQAREAHVTACRLSDELSGCTMAAFGVGRGVDRTELLHIIDTSEGDAPRRYLDLYTRDDAPW